MNMARCPQCGAESGDQAQFCHACGRLLAGQERKAANVPPIHRRYGGRRVVVVFLAVIAVIGIIFVVGMVYFIRHTSIVTSTKNGGRVESPFGVVTASNDPAKLAHSLGVEIFPGAVGEKGAQAQLASSNIASLSFRTSAPAGEVINFYHIRYPDATLKTNGDQITLVQINLRDTLTIRASPLAGHTEIQISDVEH
ncbi:MAG TPA: zinc ribbon domain-containing protein [Terriglobales bacterium]|jgi:hypothetical protein